MRRALILLALSPLLVAQSGVPHARCDFGAGAEALREAARLTAQPISGLLEGRARGEVVAARLRGAVPVFLGCGCPRLAEFTAEAAGLAAALPGEASMARLVATMEQARFRISLAEQHLGRQGCR
jgi:hypothetical protein